MAHTSVSTKCMSIDWVNGKMLPIAQRPLFPSSDLDPVCGGVSCKLLKPSQETKTMGIVFLLIPVSYHVIKTCKEQ